MSANTGERQFKLISELLLSTWISFISNFHQYQWDSERDLSRREGLGREGWENSLLFQQTRNCGSKLIWANFPLKQSQNLLKLSNVLSQIFWTNEFLWIAIHFWFSNLNELYSNKRSKLKWKLPKFKKINCSGLIDSISDRKPPHALGTHCALRLRQQGSPELHFTFF